MDSTFRARYTERRQYMLDKLGNRCAWCGSPDDLEIDHIDRKLKTLPFGRCLHYSIEELDAELANAQILCKTCHIVKTGTEWEHGVNGYNKHACRCDTCRREYALWRRKYNPVKRHRNNVVPGKARPRLAH